VSCFISAAAERYFDTVKGRVGNGYAHGGSEPEALRPLVASGFFHGIVGHSAAMQRVFADVRRIASASSPVLVLGETGTGKELIARAIHDVGPRRHAPFIALNCAALPRELIEAELFGYRRGAFSGAVNDCPGLFRAATGGTLLLDEITEMGPDLQAKLLRVLQERCVRPVGAVREEAVDVRVIASSNRDPEAATKAGLLRADLFYRLCVSTIVLPPLRERREDVPALVEYFLATMAERAGEGGGRTPGMTPESIDFLERQPWPGNVRELFNLLENAFTMGTPLITTEQLERPALVSDRDPARGRTPHPPTYRDAERAVIERALASAEGNKVRAARQLGISRKKLYAKIAQYGLATRPLGET